MTAPPPAVAAAFDAMPGPARARLLALRGMILDVAAEDPAIGPLDESLKWGQPSYATPSGSGTPLRLSLAKSGDPAILAHCQTRVIPDFRALFGAEFAYDGTRAVHLPLDRPLATEPLRLLIHSALTYRLRQRAG
ncbi:DUF1801 domain-containing protein [Mesobacterium pallidum]|uniref:DUF1801 domain-containing protein n=1 Tax=Mesobacterium pallidum TaxID=2872037 RepID=UPI001EE3986D|nr:DUF1801 domain-containing protein [Mesobacterium pallidum]